MTTNLLDKFQGSLLGGACGDALGYPVEFMDAASIRAQYGPNGIEKLERDCCTRRAHFSDDTQMTLFTANGLLLACYEKGGVSDPAISAIRCWCWTAYQRWLYTQAGKCALTATECRKPFEHEPMPFIMSQTYLYARRAPGRTCMSALQSFKVGTPEMPLNDSKGCGGVMRVAPCGLLFYKHPDKAYKAAVEAAALTHGHVAGYTSAGALAFLIAFLTRGDDLHSAVTATLLYLSEHDKSMDTYHKLHDAVTLSAHSRNVAADIVKLGGGWVGDEALAIAVYCALVSEDDPKKAIALAVNHDGDSDSTGAICGNIVGAIHGASGLPEAWRDAVEGTSYLEHVATGLFDAAEKL